MGKSLVVLLVGITFCSYIPTHLPARASLTSQSPAMSSSLCKGHRWFQIYRIAPCKHVFFALAFRDWPVAFACVIPQQGTVRTLCGMKLGRQS